MMKNKHLWKMNVLLAFTVFLSVLLLGSEPLSSKAYAANTVFNQKGSGILGWHATPYGGGFTEDKMKANTDWLAANFKDAGYEYVSVDGWVGDTTVHNADGYITTYKNDWQHDWKYWADYVHSKGLKLGIYYNPSWVHQSIADDTNNKIIGTDIPIKSITDPAHMHQTRYIIDPSKSGSEQYVKGMINYYKSVGVDLLKIDFIRYVDDAYGPEATTTLYRWMREAAGDDMILYYANAKNRNHAQDEVKYADIIRASEDWRTNSSVPGVWYHTSARNRGQVKDNSWPPAYNIFDGFDWLSDVSGRGKVVIDGDFSVLSSGGTDAEKKTRISLLALAGSSINIGDNFSNIGQNDVYYLNPEILEMNKKGFVGKPLSRDLNDSRSQIWQGKLADGTWIVGLFNREDTAQSRSVNFSQDLGLKGSYTVSDMWSHSGLGVMSSYSENIEPHGVRLLKIADNTPPTLKLNVNGTTMVEGTAYADDQMVTFNLSAEDSLSGVDTQTITLDGKSYTIGTTMDLAGKLGDHSLRVTATDFAGNTMNQTFTFKVNTNIQSILNLIDRYIASGDIKGSLVNLLKNNLDQARHQTNKVLPKQVIHFLQEALKHLNDNPKLLYVSDDAKTVLNTDLQSLITGLSGQ
ncbi:FIMAH domain-containing protein [Paenibacillus solisilvae]|uniref:FIMAH domain-containing protein n=1 Tax=Paenibacillus solisilvae TaxID=2486751 RepID=A0ABW0VXN7_9BACL